MTWTAATGLLTLSAWLSALWLFASALQTRLCPDAGTAGAVAARVLFAAASSAAVAALLGFSGFFTRTAFWLCFAALGAVGWRFRPAGGEKRPLEWLAKAAGLPSSQKVALLVFAAVMIQQFFWAAATPAPPWDAYVYHLPFPAAWLQMKKILPIVVPFGDQAGCYFPANGELLYAQVLAALGSDQMANTLQLLFLAAIPALLYALSREMGAGHAPAFWCALAAPLAPEILHQARAAEVDVIFAFFFLAAVHFGVRYRNAPDARRAACFAAAFGLLVGCKYVGLPFGALALPIAFGGWTRSRRKSADAALWAVLSFLTGGFWFARNFLLTGNPVFPMEFKPFGVEALPGAYGREAMLNSVFHTDSLGEIFALYRSHLGDGIGTMFLFAAFLPLLRLLAPGGMKGAGRWLAALPLAALAVQVWVVPYNTQIRFSYGAVLLAFALLAKAVEETPPVRGLVLATLPAAALLGLAKDRYFPESLLHLFSAADATGLTLAGATPAAALSCLALCLIFVAASLRRTPSRVPPAAAAAAFCLVLFAWCLLVSRGYEARKADWHRNFPIGRGWGFVARSFDRPMTVAYTGTDLSYGLYGPNLRNRVFYAHVNGHPDWKFHDFVRAAKELGAYRPPETDRVDLHRQDPDYEAWLANLRREGANLLYVAVLHQTDLPHLPHDGRGFPIEETWAAAHPEAFRLLHENSQVKIYGLLAPSAR